MPPLITVQIDDSMLTDATDIGIGMKDAGHSKDPVPPEHVLHTAINLGLAELKPKWPRKPEESKP